MSRDPIADGQVVEDADLKWELFWIQNKTKILAAAAGLGIALIAAGGWYVNAGLTRAAAERLLATAETTADWENVIARYPRSAPAADAYFRLAAAQRDGGGLDASTATFRKFLDVFPKHELSGGALYGVAQNLDLAGNPAEAAKTFEEVAGRFPESYAAPAALYAAAEIKLRSFEREEARRLLERVLNEYRASAVARMAAGQLAALGVNVQGL